MTDALLTVALLAIAAAAAIVLEMIRRGHAETGRHRIRCSELEAEIAARRAARPPVGCLHPPRLTVLLESPARRVPRYADYLPPVLAAPPVMNVPHGGPARPSTSPDDLQAAVRRMCSEAELYVADLIAATRHTERGHPW